MDHPKYINIQQFNYELPHHRIAAEPLKERDSSKLLVYQNGNINDDIYKNISHYIPEGSMLVFNDTRVINARIIFHKTTGAKIEIFCLEPAGTITEFAIVLAQKRSATWKCFVGGLAKWGNVPLSKSIVVKNKEIQLTANHVERLSEGSIINFEWNDDDITFGEVLEATGNTPLPPYIKRKVNENDKERYQTIYAQHEGSVAAPTAGLHFTENIFSSLAEKNVLKTNVTLHVGAGTFKPVTAETLADHEMHAEWIDVSIGAIIKLRDHENVIAVGTTSLRTLETLYWLGVQASAGAEELKIDQWYVYESNVNVSAYESLTALVNWLKKHNKERLFIQTRLLIAPGYKFRIVKGLITNFHQPQSTLLLLVAAAIGNKWKALYNHALENDYRFLSYGDGNLIFIDQG